MSLDSLPNEVIINIIMASHEPSNFCFWLRSCKRFYNVILDQNLIELMKLRFKAHKKEVRLFKNNSVFDIVEKYPNGTVNHIKRYVKWVKSVNIFILAQECDIVGNKLHGKLITYSTEKEHSGYVCKYKISGSRVRRAKGYIETLLTEFTISVFISNKIIQTCEFIKGIPHGKLENFSGQYCECCNQNHNSVIYIDNGCVTRYIDEYTEISFNKTLSIDRSITLHHRHDPNCFAIYDKMRTMGKAKYTPFFVAMCTGINIDIIEGNLVKFNTAFEGIVNMEPYDRLEPTNASTYTRYCRAITILKDLIVHKSLPISFKRGYLRKKITLPKFKEYKSWREVELIRLK